MHTHTRTHTQLHDAGSQARDAALAFGYGCFRHAIQVTTAHNLRTLKLQRFGLVSPTCKRALHCCSCFCGCRSCACASSLGAHSRFSGRMVQLGQDLLLLFERQWCRMPVRCPNPPKFSHPPFLCETNPMICSSDINLCFWCFFPSLMEPACPP